MTASPTHRFHPTLVLLQIMALLLGLGTLFVAENSAAAQTEETVTLRRYLIPVPENQRAFIQRIKSAYRVNR